MFLMEQYCSFIADRIWIFAKPEGHRLIDNAFSEVSAPYHTDDAAEYNWKLLQWIALWCLQE